MDSHITESFKPGTNTQNLFFLGYSISSSLHQQLLGRLYGLD